jgi:hypothetical protein
MEDFEWTLHRAVKAENGSALAKRMGVNESRLLDCANPNRENHRMSLELFGQVLTHLPEEGRRLVLGALLNEFGYALVEKEAVKAKDLTSALLQMSAEVADVTRSVTDALGDGHVSQHEKQLIKRELIGARDSLATLEAAIKAA